MLTRCTSTSDARYRNGVGIETAVRNGSGNVCARFPELVPGTSVHHARLIRALIPCFITPSQRLALRNQEAKLWRFVQ